MYFSSLTRLKNKFSGGLQGRSWIHVSPTVTKHCRNSVRLLLNSAEHCVKWCDGCVKGTPMVTNYVTFSSVVAVFVEGKES